MKISRMALGAAAVSLMAWTTFLGVADAAESAAGLTPTCAFRSQGCQAEDKTGLLVSARAEEWFPLTCAERAQGCQRSGRGLIAHEPAPPTGRERGESITPTCQARAQGCQAATRQSAFREG